MPSFSVAPSGGLFQWTRWVYTPIAHASTPMLMAACTITRILPNDQFMSPLLRHRPLFLHSRASLFELPQFGLEAQQRRLRVAQLLLNIKQLLLRGHQFFQCLFRLADRAGQFFLQLVPFRLALLLELHVLGRDRVLGLERV